MNRRLFAAAEISGAAAVIASAFLLWSLFELTGGSPLAVLFGSVNLSAWEMMKGATVPFMLCALVELMCAKPFFKTFVVGKAAGLLICSVMFLVVYCLFFNGVAALVISTAAGFGTSYFLSSRDMGQRSFFAPSWMFCALFFIMLISFTVYPPKIFLFRDPVSGFFGV